MILANKPLKNIDSCNFLKGLNLLKQVFTADIWYCTKTEQEQYEENWNFIVTPSWADPLFLFPVHFMQMQFTDNEIL